MSVPPPVVSSRRRDDPVQDKLNDYVDIARRIKNGEDAAGDTVHPAVDNTVAVLGLALPHAIAHVHNLMDESRPGYTLSENTLEALGQYYCDCAEESSFYTQFQIIDVKNAIRRGVQAPDELRNRVNCEKCPSCVSRKLSMTASRRSTRRVSIKG